MTAIFKNSNVSFTENGAVTNASTLSKVLDFFTLVGASRGRADQIVQQFWRAYEEDADLAIRAALYMRDARKGAGERDNFRAVLRSAIERNQEVVAQWLCSKVPELGRWDDLEDAVLAFEDVAGFWAEATATNGLAAKWAPRQGKVAVALRNALGLTPKQWRRRVVDNSKTVEQLMSAGRWSEINYEHVPSCAAKRLTKAFARNDNERFTYYLSKLEKGEAKVNASVVYPHDVVTQVIKGGVDARFAEQQWKALPDFLNGTKEVILPVVDVSGSMGHLGYSIPITVAVSLGIYLAERAPGQFKNKIISFSGRPNVHDISAGSLAEKVDKVRRSGEDMSTNLIGVFERLLAEAKHGRIPQGDMPTMLLILSDMEFNSVQGYGTHSFETNFSRIKRMFESNGYTMPKLVFWNLESRGTANKPVTKDEINTCMISGFSPSAFSYLGDLDQFTPMNVMLNTLRNPRYDY